MRKNLAFVMCCVALLAAPSAWAGGKKGETGKECYFSIAASNDHIVSGCDISGYHLRYDLAKSMKVFMVVLPDRADGFEKADVYFVLDTFSLKGHSVEELFEHDWKGTAKKLPGIKVVKRLTHTLNLNGKKGECYGQTILYPNGYSNFYQGKQKHFRYETYYFCWAGNKDYALFASLEAVSLKALEKATPAFLKWLDLPQMVMAYDPAKDKHPGMRDPASDLP